MTPQSLPSIGDRVATTPTGIPIRDCSECGYRHPITRKHCPVCGRATLFCHKETA